MGEMVEIHTGETVYANVTKKEPVLKWPIREGKFYAMFMGGMCKLFIQQQKKNKISSTSSLFNLFNSFQV